MKMQVFTVYDSKAEFYSAPFYQQNVGMALRAFEDTVGDPESALCRHPEDFTLFHMGEWENLDCTFDLFATPRAIAKAIEVRKAPMAPLFDVGSGEGNGST